jgi:hypothetical protein
MEERMATDKFVNLADKLFRSAGVAAKEIQLLNGRTFVATFATEASADKAAAAIFSALKNVRVAAGMDPLKEAVPSGTVTRRETKVWRVHGML